MAIWAAWRARIEGDLGKPAAEFLDSHDDDALAALFTDLGGHCMESLVEAFDAAHDDVPTLFIAYTVKGYGLPFAGHKDNHAGLMTPAQMETHTAGTLTSVTDERVHAIGDCAEHRRRTTGFVAPAWEQAEVLARVIRACPCHRKFIGRCAQTPKASNSATGRRSANSYAPAERSTDSNGSASRVPTRASSATM